MLNESEYQTQSFLYNLLVYMNVATAQPDKKSIGKLKSMTKKLRPKYMYQYTEATPDDEVKDGIEELEEFSKTFKQSPETGN